jgi:hypothetical protein
MNIGDGDGPKIQKLVDRAAISGKLFSIASFFRNCGNDEKPQHGSKNGKSWSELSAAFCLLSTSVITIVSGVPRAPALL